MKDPSPDPTPEINTVDPRLDQELNLLLAAYWFDALEPFDIEWELIWPM